jgi:hypothetical protein
VYVPSPPAVNLKLDKGIATGKSAPQFPRVINDVEKAHSTKLSLVSSIRQVKRMTDESTKSAVTGVKHCGDWTATADFVTFQVAALTAFFGAVAAAY